MVYVATGTGFKDGGFDARAASSGPYTFGPEQETNFKGRVKSTLFDGTLVFNADIYRMMLDAAQVSTLNPATGVEFTVGNAGNVRVQGAEVDAQWRPVRYLSGEWRHELCRQRLDLLSPGPVHFHLSDGRFAAAGRDAAADRRGVGTCNYAGFTPPYSPKWRWNVDARWGKAPWGDRASGGLWRGTSPTYAARNPFDPSLDPRSFEAGYVLFDASVGLERDKWRVSLWGKNLFDKSYYVAGFAQGLGAFVNAGGTAAANGFVGFYGVPRTFGLEASYRY